MPSGSDADPLQSNGHPLAGSSSVRCLPLGCLVCCRPHDFLAGSQGFEEAQGDITMARVLAGEQRQLLPEHWEAQGPIGE